MSYGTGNQGKSGSWGGADFFVTNHEPIDNATNINRTPSIAFSLVSQSSIVDLTTINLTANGIQLITNGAFTINASGTINSTDPNYVNIVANLVSTFAPLAIVAVIVDAKNISNASPAYGTTWQFQVNNIVSEFSTYITSKFERVLRVNAGPLEAPRNPHAEIELLPPSSFTGVVI